MKKLWPLALLLISSIAHAGVTALTATVQDSSGQVFANGTVKAEFFPNGLPGPFLSNGSTFPTTVTGTLDGTGTFSMSLTDNNTIQPFGTKWKFTVCSNTSAPCSTSVQTVTGASQNLSSSISNDMAAIAIPGFVVPTAYQDAEVNTKNVTLYYNVTNGSFRYWSGVWATISGGGGGGSVTVNGVVVSNPNFNNTNPVPQANFLNCTWQVNSPNVSLECPFGTTGTSFAVGNDNRITGAAQQNGNNTYTAINNFSSATLQLPLIPNYAPTVQGLLGLDNANFLLKLGLNGTTATIPWVSGAAPSGCAQWSGNFLLTGTGVACGSGGGSGTVTSFSAGTLSPLFTTSVATATSTPALTFTLSNAAAGTVFGNSTGGSAAPTYFVPTTGLLSDFPSQATHAGAFLTTNGSVLSWGSPSGSGTVTSGTAFCFTWYASAGTSVSSNPRLCENAGGTQLSYTGTSGITAPLFTASGTGSGAVGLSGATSGTATIQVGSAAGTPIWTLATTNAIGIWHEGAAGQLSSSPIALASADVSGLLPGANGGTGVNSTATYPSSGTIPTGTGSTNTLIKWTGSSSQGNSSITDDGTTAGIPATCTVGETYFANDATAGQNLYGCTTTNIWTQEGGTGGGGGANTSLSNLVSVAINTSLLPGSAGTISTGSGTFPWQFMFFSGASSTPGTNNFQLTGTSTGGTRVITFPDASFTVSGLSGTTTTGFIPKFASGLLTNSKLDDGITAANTLTYSDTGGLSLTGSGSGSITFNGATSGSAGITVPAVAGTTSKWLMPTTDPTSGQFLQAGTPSGGFVPLSWVTLSGGGNVSASGTPTSGQAAEWVTATTIQGVSVTGSGNYVKASSPSLVTPTLGVASVTTVNKLTITPPATGSTLTVADGKTLTATNSMDVAKTVGVSGGVPFYDTTGSMSASALLAANQPVAGGGSGTAPATVSVTPTTLTDGATITWALASAYLANATVTIAGNRTLNISSPLSGGTYVLRVVQDTIGSRTLTLGTGCTWKVISGGAGAITLTTTANAIDVLSFYYDGTNCYANLGKNYN